MEIIKRKQWM